MSGFRVADVLPDLHLLTIIAQTRNLTQAARRLGISKASVSTRLRDLERVVGMSLVRRTTRSVTLTAAALQLVDDTQASFAASSRASNRRRIWRVSRGDCSGYRRRLPSDGSESRRQCPISCDGIRKYAWSWISAIGL